MLLPQRSKLINVCRGYGTTEAVTYRSCGVEEGPGLKPLVYGGGMTVG
jgi:hypothetical protein